MTEANKPDLQRPVRLSIVTQFYPPDYAATGQLIEELATHLGQQGMEIQIFTGQPGYAFCHDSAPAIERSDQLVVRRSRSSRLWPQRIRGKAVNGLLFCIRSGLHLLQTAYRGDILLLTTAPPYLPILGYLANLLFRIPYVCLVYDLYPDVAIELNVVRSEYWLVRLWDLVNQWVWQRAKQVIVLSPTMKQRIVEKSPALASKISVIHSWANPHWIVPIAKKDNWFAHKYDLVDTFTVLYSGNMGRCHDMETIMEAVWHLRDQPIRFVFIGSGAKCQACISKAQSLGLTNCLFLPYQEKRFLPYSLTACDLSLVSISPGMEGLVAPSKLYGILAAGRPVAVICEKHSYLRQMLNEANCGRAFLNGDSLSLANFILGLAADRKVAARMGIAGRHYLKANFTPEIIANQYSQILHQYSRSQQRSRHNQPDGSVETWIRPVSHKS